MWQIKHETGQHVRIILKINDTYHSTVHEVATKCVIIKIDTNISKGSYNFNNNNTDTKNL